MLTCSNIVALVDRLHWSSSLTPFEYQSLHPKMVTSAQTFSLPIRVFYEDTDLGGIVYYANYLKFMERARTEYLRGLGFHQSELLAQERRMFVVKSADIDFVSPARFDDLISVTAEVKTVRKASLLFRQECSVLEPASNTVADSVANKPLVTADVLIACVDADSFKPCSVPEPLKMVLNR